MRDELKLNNLSRVIERLEADTVGGCCRGIQIVLVLSLITHHMQWLRPRIIRIVYLLANQVGGQVDKQSEIQHPVSQ